MTFQECCKTCKHCISKQTASYGWCQLRKIKVHPDIAQYIFCHHWSQQEPSLPKLEESNLFRDKQLDFGRTFVSQDSV